MLIWVEVGYSVAQNIVSGLYKCLASKTKYIKYISCNNYAFMKTEMPFKLIEF